MKISMLLISSACFAFTLGACLPQSVTGPQPEIPRRDGGSGTDANVAVCNGECTALQYTTCTCTQSDPCGWTGDGVCDQTQCQNILSSGYLQDTVDCDEPPPPDCTQDCQNNAYTQCTCGTADPCHWVGDGYCDLMPADASCAVFSGHFNDSADCTTTPPPPVDCGTDCSQGAYTACSCGTTDPCNWAGDNYCDNACNQVLATPFDDSQDCGNDPPPVTGDENYIVTAVSDNLDDNDGSIMYSQFEALGYGEGLVDGNVTTTSLRNYLQMDVEALYHTGHGDMGLIVTYDGELYRNNVTVAVHNVVIATCLTLYYSWSSSMASTCQNLLGYTEVTYDFLDDDVATDFGNRLRSGYNYIQSWYLANATRSELSDRWAGYVREGSSIVEYSARTNHKPTGVGADMHDGEPVDPEARLWVARSLLENNTVFTGTIPSVKVVGDVDAESGFLKGGWSRLTSTNSDAKHAIEVAEAFAQAQFGAVPQGAVVDDVVTVTSSVDEGARETIGYQVRYGRRYAGYAVRSNGLGDHISVLVSGDKVVAWSRYWPELENQNQATPTQTLLSAQQALAAAAPQISRMVKGKIRFVDVETVLGSKGANHDTIELVPAWAFIAEDGSKLIVDAYTGRVLY